jgi:predicted GNAT family acetyltransferase
VGIRNCEADASLRTIEDLALLSRKGTFYSNPSIYVAPAMGCTAIIFFWYDFQIVAGSKSQARESAMRRIGQSWTPSPIIPAFTAITQLQ